MRTYEYTTGYGTEDKLFNKDDLWVGDSEEEWMRHLTSEEREEHITNISKLSESFSKEYFENMVQIKDYVSGILPLIKEKLNIENSSYDNIYPYLSDNTLMASMGAGRDQLLLPLDESVTRIANISDKVEIFIIQLKKDFPELGEHDEN